jgi:hypothetical protein
MTGGNAMNYLTADENVCDLLRGVLVPVEVRDGNGILLGHYTPHVPPELVEKYEKVKQRLNSEGTARRTGEEQGKGAPLAEVLKRIQAREKPE